MNKATNKITYVKSGKPFFPIAGGAGGHAMQKTKHIKIDVF